MKNQVAPNPGDPAQQDLTQLVSVDFNVTSGSLTDRPQPEISQQELLLDRVPPPVSPPFHKHN